MRLIETDEDAGDEIGEKPMNQVSLLSLVVPVLPASGLPMTETLLPVPRWITPSIIETT